MDNKYQSKQLEGREEAQGSCRLSHVGHTAVPDSTSWSCLVEVHCLRVMHMDLTIQYTLFEDDRPLRMTGPVEPAVSLGYPEKYPYNNRQTCMRKLTHKGCQQSHI
jgi:hypothetical protein